MAKKCYQPILMSGISTGDGSIQPETLVPITNTFVAIGKDNDYSILKTDAAGVVCTVKNAGGKISLQPHFQGTIDNTEKNYGDKYLYVIPDRVIQDSWFYEQGGGATSGDVKPWRHFTKKWIDTLSGEKDSKVSLDVKQFTRDQLIKPRAEDSPEYKKFYDSLDAQEGVCIFVNRARVIAVVCANLNLFATTKTEKITIELQLPFVTPFTGKIELINETDETDETEDTNDTKGAKEKKTVKIGMLVSDQENLPAGETTFPVGVYTVTINYADLNKQLPWSPLVKEKGLVISAPVNFSIRTVSIEYGVIIIDPVSLEDAILMQFTGRYSSTLVKVLDADSNDTEAAQLFAVFGDWKAKTEWVRGQYAQGKSMLKPMLKPGDFYSKFKFLVNFGIKHSSDGMFPDWFVNTFKVSTGGIDYIQKYQKFLNDKDNLKSIEKAFEALNFKCLKDMTHTSLANVLAKANIESEFFRTFTNFVKAEKQGSAFYEIPVEAAEKVDFLTKAEKIEKGYSSVTTGFDLALSTVEMAAFAYNAFCSAKSVGQRRDDLSKLIKEYCEHFQNGCSRDVMCILERYRQALYASRDNADKAAIETIYAGVNLALAAAALIPGLQFPAGLIMFTKEGIEGAIGLYDTVTKALDRHFLSNMFAVRKETAKRLKVINNTVCQSNLEIYEVKDDEEHCDVKRQLHIRTEVINGLVELIERAGSKTDTDFDDAVANKYRIDEYIRFFIFEEGGEWVFPKNVTVPISLAMLWHYYMPDKKSDPSDFLTLFSKKLFAQNLQRDDLIDGIDKMGAGSPIFWEPGNNDTRTFKVHFNKYFPIHYMSSGITPDSLKKFAKAFSVNYDSVQSDFIEVVLVYHRKPWDKEWKPIWKWKPGAQAQPGKSKNPDILSITPVTPLDTIRICVVCKEDPTDAIFYPLSIQLVRMGYLNLGNYDGPLYKKNSYRLKLGGDDGLGLLTVGDGAQYEKQYVGRHGAVIYPFYTFANELLFGLKPFQKSGFIAPEIRHQIAIRVTIGDANSKTRTLKYFYPPQKPGQLPLNGKAEIPLIIDATGTKGQSEKERYVQSLMVKDSNFISHKNSDGSPQPPLLAAGKQFEIVGYYFKKAGSWTFFANDKKEISCGLGDQNGIDFNWSEPFEMVVVFGANGINDKIKNNVDYPWRKVPIQLQWIQKVKGWTDAVANIAGQDTNDIKGPSYSTAFHYLGYINKFRTGLCWNESHKLDESELPHHEEIDSKQVREILDNHILTNRENLSLKQLNYGWLFAGHYRFNYELPGSRAIANALRPFGEIKEKDLYVQYTFKISDQAKGTGGNILIDQLSGAGSGKVSNLILKLPSPYKATLPPVWGSKKLSNDFLDTSKIASAYLSLTDEVLTMR